jgi:flagellar motor switch protein FliN/FliY|uniref:Flagellar motor switch protein FliN n=1 Tax=Desulfobacca acetoxidans TaxID=60893 RepID=A0A7V6DNP0_9BACT
MTKTGNPQAVEDFDWEKTPEGEHHSPTPTGDAFGAEPIPESSAATPKEKKEKVSSMEILLDIPLEISAELGRTRMIISDLLQLGQGSVIELNKLAGEPLEILVNQKLIARGEVVVVNEKFGIRLTDIISPLERIKQLG